MTQHKTKVSFNGEKILINGRPTYEGCKGAEGLLFNIRTVNATFDDTLGKVDYWDDDGTRPENDYAGYGKWCSPESAYANTQRFIKSLPDYKSWGILGINLNFQGGHPVQFKTWIPKASGSANSHANGQRDFLHNSGFREDGSIDEDYAARIGSVIEACDGLGMVVILQLFYFGQDTVFTCEDSIKAAVDSTVDFVCQRGYTNVLIEIANEVMQWHYHHSILKPSRVAELILRARERAEKQYGRSLPVSTSEAALLAPKEWTLEQIDTVYEASDFVLLHGGDGLDHGDIGDHTEVAKKIDLIRSRPWYRESPKPIIFNESDGCLAFDAVVKRGASFGLHSGKYLQTVWPPKWGVWDNETMWFYRRVRELTGEQNRQTGC